MASNSTLRPLLRLKLAQLLVFLGQERRAVATLRFALAEYPGLQQGWRYLAFLLSMAKENDAAIEAFRTAIGLDPADAETRFNLGFLLQQLGRLAEAAVELEEVTRLAPKLDRAWYGLGLILLEQNQFQQAADNLREAVRLQYFNPNAGYYLSFAYHKLGEHGKALAECERVNSYDPKVGARMRRDFGLG